MTKTWMVGAAGSECDGVVLRRVTGTKAQVKMHLAKMVREDRANDPEGYDYGSSAAKDVQEDASGALQAYAVFGDYHIDYTAVPEPEPVVL